MKDLGRLSMALLCTSCLLAPRGRGDDDDAVEDVEDVQDVGEGDEVDQGDDGDPPQDEPGDVVQDDDSGCNDDCSTAFDGECDDGGPGAEYDVCALGTDCSDCGPRGAGGEGEGEGEGELDCVPACDNGQTCVSGRCGGAECVPSGGDCSGGSLCCMSPALQACFNGGCCLLDGEPCGDGGMCCEGSVCVSTDDGPFVCERL